MLKRTFKKYMRLGWTWRFLILGDGNWYGVHLINDMQKRVSDAITDLTKHRIIMHRSLILDLSTTEWMFVVDLFVFVFLL